MIWSFLQLSNVCGKFLNKASSWAASRKACDGAPDTAMWRAPNRCKAGMGSKTWQEFNRHEQLETIRAKLSTRNSYCTWWRSWRRHRCSNGRSFFLQGVRHNEGTPSWCSRRAFTCHQMCFDARFTDWHGDRSIHIIATSMSCHVSWLHCAYLCKASILANLNCVYLVHLEMPFYQFPPGCEITGRTISSSTSPKPCALRVSTKPHLLTLDCHCFLCYQDEGDEFGDHFYESHSSFYPWVFDRLDCRVHARQVPANQAERFKCNAFVPGTTWPNHLWPWKVWLLRWCVLSMVGLSGNLLELSASPGGSPVMLSVMLW